MCEGEWLCDAHFEASVNWKKIDRNRNIRRVLTIAETVLAALFFYILYLGATAPAIVWVPAIIVWAIGCMVIIYADHEFDPTA